MAGAPTELIDSRAYHALARNWIGHTLSTQQMVVARASPMQINSWAYQALAHRWTGHKQVPCCLVLGPQAGLQGYSPGRRGSWASYPA